MESLYSGGFDAHTHLDLPALDGARDAACARARATGIDGWIIAAADPADWDRVESTARATGGVAALGIHPWWAPAECQTLVAELERRRPALLGEMGLDRLRGPELAIQRRAFEAQLELAVASDTPVVIHCVRAWHEVRPMLRDAGCRRGMVHAFVGSPEQAFEAVRLGFLVSFGFALRTSTRTLQAAAAIPLPYLLVETDCPPGEPADVLDVVERIARVRRMEVAELLRITGENARRFTGITEGRTRRSAPAAP